MSAGLPLLAAALMGSLLPVAGLTGFQNDIYGAGCQRSRFLAFLVGMAILSCVKYLSILIL